MWLYRLPHKGHTEMLGSGQKEEVKMLWEEAVEAFERSVPAGRHLASRGGSTFQQAEQERWTYQQLESGWEHQQSCHCRRGLLCCIRGGGSNQAGGMDHPPAPSGVDGLEHIMVCSDHPNDCQGKHLSESGYEPVSPSQKNGAHQEQQSASEQAILPRRRVFPGISHQIFPLQKLSPKRC